MRIEIGEIKTKLANQAEAIARELLPGGKRTGQEWQCGDLNGKKGRSLGVHLTGSKAGIWSDFATGESGDLLDLYVSVRGCTMAEAVRWGKERLGVRDPQFYGKQEKLYRKPERRKAYRTPQNGCLGYLQERAFTPEIIKALKLAEIESWTFSLTDGSKHTCPAVVFPFTVDKELRFIKHLGTERPEGKKLIWVETGCEPVLFGWQVVPTMAREIIICEGELNAASWLQYGFPALATPFGAGKGGKHKWLDNEWERLERFETIWLDFDQDESGREAVADLVNRLGRHRCRVVPAKPVTKDINDCLMAGISADQVAALLKDSPSCDPIELRRAGEFTEEVIEEFYPSEQNRKKEIEIPFCNLLGKFTLRLGETTVWTGYGKHGKTQLLNYIYAMIAAQGERICIASFEMRAKKILKRITRQATTQREPSQAYIRQVMAWANDQIWIFDHVGSARQSKILEIFEYAYRRYGIKYFIVDSLMKCGISGEDLAGQDAFVDALVNFANLHNVHLSLVAHSRKGNDESKPPNGQDVKGSGGIKDQFHNTVVVWRNKAKEKVKENISGVEITDTIYRKLQEPDTYMIVDCQREGEGDTPTQPLWYDKDSQTYRDNESAIPKPLIAFSTEGYVEDYYDQCPEEYSDIEGLEDYHETTEC